MLALTTLRGGHSVSVWTEVIRLPKSHEGVNGKGRKPVLGLVGPSSKYTRVREGMEGYEETGEAISLERAPVML